MPRSLTVGQLIRQLQDLDPDQPARLAINPDWPFSHYVGRVLDADGAVFIAEDGQEGYLPHGVGIQLDWLTGSNPVNARDSHDAPWSPDAPDAAHVVTGILDGPGWTVDDDSLPATYSAPGGHPWVRHDDDGWLYEARKAPEADPTWHVHFTSSVPADAIRAFTAALLATS
ncbi:DUF317 domain-containing protein [Streptomyces silvisoli]|uniref:DUF317 domain-containing protein n=1 Tax=Streptomyces silvisoli TaxID=3034235 RepID=A0ABT5ZPZ2_9ACTN|nr:DUF317 domain-containing protein [Streptomyces silvisoli]MDF3291900.1 DUF317 domain-containing protein [Streptomyces silvisoli]